LQDATGRHQCPRAAAGGEVKVTAFMAGFR